MDRKKNESGVRLGSKWWEGRHEGSWKVYDKSRCITVEVQIIAVPILLKNDPILLAFPKLVPCSCTIVTVIYHFMGDCSMSSSVWLLRIAKRISNNFYLWPMNFFTSYIPNSLYLIVHCLALFQCVLFKSFTFLYKRYRFLGIWVQVLSTEPYTSLTSLYYL